MFDRFVVVDWSAQSTPKRGVDSIWICVRDRRGSQSFNPSTRMNAARILDDIVDSDPGVRTLIGVDFSLGYPVGTAAALGLAGGARRSTWELLAQLIVDGPTNRNNRFEVAGSLNERITGACTPFWGCPPSARSAHLGSTKPADFGLLDEWRAVESTLRTQGRRPFSSWQLLGAGAVGSQSLLGIPVIRRLVARLGRRAQVWPFTTGLHTPTVGRGGLVIAEVWPSLLDLGGSTRQVRDEMQVEAVAAWFATCARDGSLATRFAPEVSADVVDDVELEEGWVLGVG